MSLHIGDSIACTKSGSGLNIRGRLATLCQRAWSLSIFVASLSLLVLQISAAERPNVVLIITDDQGYGDIGFHGNPVIQTPKLDELARESVRLTNFHVDPTCAETRAALMTGQYPMRVGVWHTIMGRSLLNPEVPTLPQALKDSGYATGIFGKWHLGDSTPFRPWQRGFDESLIHGGGGVGQIPDAWGNDYVDDTYLHNGKPEKQTGYCTDVFFGAAIDFVKQHKTEPFFCYVAANAPHSPYIAPERYKSMYSDGKVPEPMANFYRMISCIDENVGNLLETLKTEGLDENTIVIFMTDNGTAAGITENAKEGQWKGFNAGMRGQKGTVWDGGHRVPCFVRWPSKIKGGRDVDRLAVHVDLMPTLLSWCDAPIPTGWHGDGLDLTPVVLEDKKDQWEDRNLIVQSQRIEKPERYRNYAVMSQRWRLVGKELFDIQADPGQTLNVAAEHPEVVEKLSAAYENFWIDVSPYADDYQRIAIGDSREEVTLLTAHDWHGENPVAYQSDLANHPPITGYWMADIKQEGFYEFRLRTRPIGTDDPMGVIRAEVNVSGLQGVSTVEKDASEAVVRTRLFRGPVKIDTVLEPEDENKPLFGAYYVYVRFLSREAPGQQGGPRKRMPQTIGVDEPANRRGPNFEFGESESTDSTGEFDDATLTSSSASENAADENKEEAKFSGKTRGIFRENDRVAFVGATLIERLQIRDELETLLTLEAPELGLTFRNVAWSGDDLTGRARAVFGQAEEGYQRRWKDLAAADPTLLVISYGINEAFDTGLSFEQVTEQAKRFLVDVSQRYPRSVVLLPPSYETASETPAFSNYAKRVTGIREILETQAKAVGIATLQLPSIKGELTDNGVHLSGKGYSIYSRQVAELLIGGALNTTSDDQKNTLTIDLAKNEIKSSLHHVSFAPVEDAKKWTWEEIPTQLPGPTRVVENSIPPAPSYSVHGHVLAKIEGLEEGSYELSIDGVDKARASAAQWKAGVSIGPTGSELQVEKVRQLIHRKNEQFFHQYRPQNETYLFLFRKHEQGNNAVEIDRFPPIIREVEKEIAKEAIPRKHVWHLRKLPNI